MPLVAAAEPDPGDVRHIHTVLAAAEVLVLALRILAVLLERRIHAVLQAVLLVALGSMASAEADSSVGQAAHHSKTCPIPCAEHQISAVCLEYPLASS